ncbi:MAG: hypothetical protein U9R72_09675, partial [Chloroflexota bacterium]|nr:hypothetical protein [Chloroflexota bacterium]
TDVRDVRVLIHRPDTRVDDLALVAYLRENPPTLIMPEAGIVRGGLQWFISERTGRLPEECLKEKSWEGCDITKPVFDTYL